MIDSTCRADSGQVFIFAAMAVIINLETASTNCSVSIYRDEELLALREDPSPEYSHDALLHVFMKESMEQAGLAPHQRQ